MMDEAAQADPTRSRTGPERRGPREESGGGASRSDTSPPAGDPGAQLAAESVSLVDALVAYLLAHLKLETYRGERRVKAMIVRGLIVVSGAAIALAGLVFLSVGVAAVLSEQLQSRPAGLLIVGGADALVGILVAVVGARARRGRDR